MSCEILHMILTIVMLTTSLQSARIVTVEASLNAFRGFLGHGQQGLYFMEDSGDGRETQFEKVSGDDETEGKEALFFKKFSALLGFKKFNTKTRIVPLAPSPSPSPSIEPKPPAPAPMSSIHHIHSHPRLHRSKVTPPPEKVLNKGRDKSKPAVVAVLVSAGVALIILVLGLFWVCLKFRRYRKRSGRTMPMYSKNRGNRGKSRDATSDHSGSKVSLSPVLEHLNLNSVGTGIEGQNYCNQQITETSNLQLDENLFDSPLHMEPVNVECDGVSCSSTKEIKSVHGDAESVKCESEDEESMKYESDHGCNFIYEDKMRDIGVSNLSDDESFHSFCDSQSSSGPLSNASAGNSSEKMEVCSPNVSNISPPSPPPSFNLTSLRTTQDLISVSASNSESNSSHSPWIPKMNAVTDSCSSNPTVRSLPPSPPPPPQIPSQYSSSASIRLASKPSTSSTLLISSSPRNSNSSSGSSQALKPPTCMASVPPPPPPPFLKGNGKVPPPPPSHLPQFTPLGKGGVPLPKLKPLHWDKVRAAPDRSTVWDKLRSSSFEFDEEMIESLFGYNFQSSMKNDEAKSKSPSPSKHVLDPKRLQNITILLKALNVTAEQICAALLRGDGLCLQQLEALAKMVPTKEEEAKLDGYKGDIDELGSAERLVKVMLSVPFAFQRIESMLYRDTFEDEVVHLRKSFSMLEEACHELRSNRLFLKLLEAVLKTGNRMNVGTVRGGARAFKLDALLKLADVKGTDGKTTLLHFVVQEMIRSEGMRVSESIMGKLSPRNNNRTVEQMEEDYRRMGLDLVSGLSTELCNVKKTASIDLDVLANSVSILSDGMAKLQNLIQKDFTDERIGNFSHSMTVFLTYAEKNLQELQEDEGKVLLHVREITEYFHGDVSKEEANPLRIFVIVRDFLGMLDHVCKELRSSKLKSTPNPLSPFR